MRSAVGRIGTSGNVRTYSAEHQRQRRDYSENVAAVAFTLIDRGWPRAVALDLARCAIDALVADGVTITRKMSA